MTSMKQENTELEIGGLNYDFDQGLKAPRLIKVIGVGGGGGNAVAEMYKQGALKGVSYLLCNTDRQALLEKGIPDYIVLGEQLTHGLGAGNKPERAAKAAEESEEEIRKILSRDGETKMVFITAGMGGGTGTGAAPIIGRIAMELGILTIGIVTIPFKFEGEKKILQAIQGVEKLRNHLDAILIINNQRLKDLYGELDIKEAFTKADQTLSNAAKGISDMIHHSGRINVDFADIQTTLKGGGVAIINTGRGRGENRVKKAIEDALKSPLLNNNFVRDAKKFLFNIYDSPEHPLKTNELEDIERFTSSLTGKFENILGYTESLTEGDEIAITVLASGFDLKSTVNSIQARANTESLGHEEEDSQEQELINMYYGEDRSKRITKPLVFELHELENDAILNEFENSIAYQRDLKPVLNIRERLKRRKQNPTTPPPSPLPEEEPDALSEDNLGSSNVIKF